MKKSFTVLIVDDDEDDRSVFCDIMDEIFPQASCLTARNGPECFHLLENEEIKRPDLIFLDINMPRMNGKQCLAGLKNIPSASEIPVVVYTTSRLASDEEETRQLGAVGFLSKPSKSNDLKCRIKRMIDEVLHLDAMPAER